MLQWVVQVNGDGVTCGSCCVALWSLFCCFLLSKHHCVNYEIPLHVKKGYQHLHWYKESIFSFGISYDMNNYGVTVYVGVYECK